MGWSSIESDADRKVQGRERQRQTDRQTEAKTMRNMETR